MWIFQYKQISMKELVSRFSKTFDWLWPLFRIVTPFSSFLIKTCLNFFILHIFAGLLHFYFLNICFLILTFLYSHPNESFVYKFGNLKVHKFKRNVVFNSGLDLNSYRITKVEVAKEIADLDTSTLSKETNIPIKTIKENVIFPIL